MKSNPVVWFEIYVQDMPRAKAFYEKVLGATLTKLDSPASRHRDVGVPDGSEGGEGAAGALAKMKGVSVGRRRDHGLLHAAKTARSEARRALSGAGGTGPQGQVLDRPIRRDRDRHRSRRKRVRSPLDEVARATGNDVGQASARRDIAQG